MFKGLKKMYLGSINVSVFTWIFSLPRLGPWLWKGLMCWFLFQEGWYIIICYQGLRLDQNETFWHSYNSSLKQRRLSCFENCDWNGQIPSFPRVSWIWIDFKLQANGLILFSSSLQKGGSSRGQKRRNKKSPHRTWTALLPHTLLIWRFPNSGQPLRAWR